MKVLLLSDTHGCCDPFIIKHARNADEVWHIGDWGGLEVADALKQHAPVYGVYGNIDDAELRLEYPEELTLQRHGLHIYMIHIGGYPQKYRPKALAYVKKHKPNVVLTGHSHILKVMPDKTHQHLHLNPGAAGVKGFHAVRTMITFEIKGQKITDLKVIEHPKRIATHV